MTTNITRLNEEIAKMKVGSRQTPANTYVHQQVGIRKNSYIVYVFYPTLSF